MSSYRGAGAAWDGGPPGAEAEYAGQRAPVPAYEPPAAPMPTTDPWTGVSYSQYGATPAYEYQAYGAASAAANYSYNYDPSYYQRHDGNYYGKYPEATAYPQQPHSAYEYPRHGDKSRSPVDSQRYNRRRSYRSKSRSVSPYSRRERDNSYDERRHRRSRSKSSKRKKYSSSDRSSSRSRSYSHSSSKKDKKKRSSSTESSSSDRSYKRRFAKNRGRSHTPPLSDKGSSSHGRTPSVNRSISNSPKHKKKSKNDKAHSSKDKRLKKVSTPPRKIKKEGAKSSKKQKKTEKSTLTPPKVYKLKDRRSESPDRESSLTPPKTYARNASLSSKSPSRTPSPRPSRRKRSTSSSHPSRSLSSSRSMSRSPTPVQRSRSKSKRKNKRKSQSKSRTKRRSVTKSRSPSKRRSKSRGKGQSSVSPSGAKSRSRSRSSRSRSSRSRSRSGSPTDRRGQFTVADRKRFWKLHRNRQEEKDKEAKTPPKEIKPPPPGVVDATALDDIEYRDPPEVEGPNFAELLHPPDQVVQPGSSKSKALPIPIKNDGSFLEMFKKMQEVTKKAEETEKKPEIKKPAFPFIGKRRGGRVLKTGLVKKAKAIDEQTADNTPKDAWSLYMQEVKKYRETSCEEERKTRPLVK